jgi:predicted permease
VVVLALGVGANTALFSIVSALYLTPLEIPEPERVCYLYREFPNGNTGAIPGALVEVVAAQAGGIAVFSGHQPAQLSLDWNGSAETSLGEVVDGAYFSVVGARTALGRLLGPADTEPFRTQSAIVISHDLWTRRFGSDPNVLGARLRTTIGGDPREFIVVGVTQSGFRGVTAPWAPSQFWIPGLPPHTASYVIGRIKDEASFEQLQSLASSTTPQLRELIRGGALPGLRQSAREAEEFQLVLLRSVGVRSPFAPDTTLISGPMLAGLWAVVGLVLIISTVNVGALLMARGVVRTSEIAVRRALGASRTRLVSHVLTESMLLATLGGILGLLVAWNLLAVFRYVAEPVFGLEVALDWRVLLFASLVCAVTGLVLSVAPAGQVTRVNVTNALGSGLSYARRDRRVRYWALIPQLSLSVLLLVVAGVHVRALVSIENTDFGYMTEGGVVARVGRTNTPARPLESGTDREKTREDQVPEAMAPPTLMHSVLDQLASAPEVEEAAVADVLPFFGYRSLPAQQVVARATNATTTAVQTRVSARYFSAMQIRFVDGRAFDTRDEVSSRRVAIVSVDLARRLWPNSAVLGQHFAFDHNRASEGPRDWIEVVGVVDEVKPILSGQPNNGLVYTPVQDITRDGLGQTRARAEQPINLVVRLRPSSAIPVALVRAAISHESSAEILRLQSTEQVVADILYSRRLAAGILTGAGIVGLVLAVIGLYGAMSYSVAQRLREAGIRATLGARPVDLVGLFMRDGARVAAIGALTGLALAIIALRVTAHILFGVPWFDVLSFVVVPGVVMTVILTACYVPARRAAAVSPVDVLRVV